MVKRSDYLPIYPDMSGPISLRREPRAAIMARAEVAWEDQPGALRGIVARIEDTSRSGACIRLSVPISIGAKVKIKWHREEFSGIAKYCRRDGGDYVLGVQREAPENSVRTPVLLQHATTSIPIPASTNIQDAPAQNEKIVQKLPKAMLDPGPVPIPAKVVASPVAAEAAAKVESENEAASKSAPVGGIGVKDPPKSDAYQRDELRAQEPSQGQGRTIVLNKLLHLGSGRQQQNAPDGNSGNTKAQVKSNDAKTPRESQTSANTRAASLPPNQGSLLSLQDIYLAVGIMNTRPGYNIDTVSAMLDSDHMRGMTSDVKRASVLMALEAAGIPVSELLQDAAKRLDALNAYEAGERKRFEEYEVRKSQESAQIQLEIERMAAHCLDRIKHNLGEVTQAKDAFLNWQTTKQKEAQRISDAVAIFTKPAAIEHPSDSKPVLQAVGADSK
jgi:hypothetical protein